MNSVSSNAKNFRRDLARAFGLKRKSFDHERELRAILTRFDTAEDAFDTLSDGSKSRRSGIAEQGEYVPFDLSALVETVYVSPRMPGWFHDVVVSAVQRFGYAFNVQQSALAAFPDYDQP